MTIERILGSIFSGLAVKAGVGVLGLFVAYEAASVLMEAAQAAQAGLAGL